ncbi:MAG: SRPBCC family protein [Lewinellaceae bacterium]|nr:SRPBCC family protein [Saprospiraceae bacterium]MCB9340797.1 SRPBCC family protein [Lewinellaceae bacterium]
MHQLKTVQKLPISLDEAWNFFSSPKNLAVITPKELNLVPTSELPAHMYPGIFIEYTVRPLLGIPTKWVTEITHVKDREYFVDEQRLGPYQIWHHQHHFKAIPGGVEMTDIVDYRIPLGPVGMLLNALFIGNKVKGIFEYRNKRLIELFGEMK